MTTPRGKHSLKSAAKAVVKKGAADKAAEREVFIAAFVESGHEKKSMYRRLTHMLSQSLMLEKSKKKSSHFEVEALVCAALLKHTGLWHEAKSVLDRMDAGEHGDSIPVTAQLQDLNNLIRATRDSLTQRKTTFRNSEGESKEGDDDGDSKEVR